MRELLRKKNLYPFLFALYPTLFLYTHNISQVPPHQMLLPIFFFLVIALLFWLILAGFIKDRGKRGFLLLFFLLLFFVYTDLLNLFKYLLLGFNLPVIKDYQFLVFLFALLILIIAGVAKSKKNFAVLTPILNITVIFLILLNLFNITLFQVGQWNRRLEFQKKDLLTDNKIERGETPESMPDIYYLVFDEFASLSTIKKIFSYNNDKFGEKLRKRGFFIATQSRGRFYQTEKVLASNLNMSFFKGRDPFEEIRNNRVSRILKGYGYSIINVVHWKHTAFTLSDRIFHFSRGKYSLILVDFYRILLGKTPLRYLEGYFMKRDIFQLAHRERVRYSLEKLENLPLLKGPKFVFAHVMTPHDPFVYNQQGEPEKAENFYNIQENKYYLNQYIYICKRIEGIIDAILNQSANDPIIIIQSDHGPRGDSQTKKNPQMGADWQSIFNALYLPRHQGHEIALDFSPVNTFRLIFNLYFQSSYKYLPK